MDADKTLGMKLFEIVCILLVLGGTCLAEDLIFFADDHYKSLGILEFRASVTNPALNPGNSLLRINLANMGRLEELIPINRRRLTGRRESRAEGGNA